MGLANDFGDTGGDWTADWRSISLDYGLMQRLRIDTQLALIKEQTLALDQEETALGLERLQKSLEKLERDAQQYRTAAERLRRDIATFLCAVHTYRSTWTPPDQPSEWRADLGMDDDIVDRMANIYKRKGHYL